MKKKLVAIVSAVAMLVTMIPATAFAQEIGGTPVEVATEEALRTAINGATGETIIKISEGGFSVAEPIVINGNENITIDLNGQTISASTEFGEDKPHKLNVFAVQSITGEGTVTIKNGTIVANANTKHVLNIWDAGKVVLENLTLDREAATAKSNEDGTTVASGAPLVINGTNVTINGYLNLIEGSNSWYGMNIDTHASGGAKEATVTVSNDATVTGSVKIENSGEDDTATATATLANNGTVTGTVELADNGAKLEGNEPNEGLTISKGEGDNVAEAVVESTKDGKTTYTSYDTLAEAADAVEDGDYIRLMKDITVSEKIVISKYDVTLDGGNHSITLDTDKPFDEKGNPPINSIIEVTGDEALVWSVKLIDSQNKAKYGVQFYKSNVSELHGVEIDGAAWAGVLVNGSQVRIADCTINPADSAYATIEYAMGTKVSGSEHVPSVDLYSVTTNGTFKIWADKATVEKVKEALSVATNEAAAQRIRENITSGNNVAIEVSIGVNDNENPVDTTIPNTIEPTTPSNPGGGTVVTPSVTKDRLAGDDRFETAVKVADQLKKELGVTKFNSVVVTYSDEFADALSATALAADKNAPILLINKSDTATAKDYIAKNLAKNGTVYIIGGTTVVPEDFAKSLTDCKVVRLGGADRYETNMEVLKELKVDSNADIMVASGLKFADALSASATGNPILLVGKTLTTAQKDYLASLGGNDDYYVIGGTVAINTTVENQLKASRVGDVARLAGDDRYETSAAVADAFSANARALVIASGADFPDGLTGGVLASAKNAPLMLVAEGYTDYAADFVDDNRVRKVTAIGGTTVMPEKVLDAIA